MTGHSTASDMVVNTYYDDYDGEPHDVVEFAHYAIFTTATGTCYASPKSYLGLRERNDDAQTEALQDAALAEADWNFNPANRGYAFLRYTYGSEDFQRFCGEELLMDDNERLMKKVA